MHRIFYQIKIVKDFYLMRNTKGLAIVGVLLAIVKEAALFRKDVWYNWYDEMFFRLL